MNKVALIANFTGFSGHFGMYATSLAIVEQLLAKGYDIDLIGVDQLRHLGSDQDAPAVLETVRSQARRADVIFINGEGTLHGWRPSSIALLSLTRHLMDASSASVHLANFSCLPGSKNTLPTEHDEDYRKVLHEVALRGDIVVRERESATVLERLGISHRVGFDSLPLCAARHFSHLAYTPGRSVLVSGGAGMNRDALRRLAVLLEANLSDDFDLIYVSGGTDTFVEADQKQFQQMSAAIPSMRFIRADSTLQFMQLISQGVHMMITGRFHYAVAARVLGTPCIAWSSNTIKTEAVREQLGLAGVFSDSTFRYEEAGNLLRSIQASSRMVDVATLRELAGHNYQGIPPASPVSKFHPATLHLYGRLLRNAGLC